jgi:hypothetical protein
VIDVSQPFTNTETGNTTVHITVDMFDAENNLVSEMGAMVTVLFKVPGLTGQNTIDIYYRQDDSQPLEYLTFATLVSATQTDSTYSFQTNHFTTHVADIKPFVPCVVTGTKILTAGGYKKVEDLVATDRIVTSEGRAVPFVRMSTVVKKTTVKNAPYCIAAHAFGRNSPSAPVTLSGLHAIQIRRGVWNFPAALANTHSGVNQVGVGAQVTYYHIRLPNYLRDNIVVEGGAIIESLGGSNKYSAEKVYTHSERLGGFTRVSAAQFDKIHHV